VPDQLTAGLWELLFHDVPVDNPHLTLLTNDKTHTPAAA
jgi:hypothetical protein